MDEATRNAAITVAAYDTIGELSGLLRKRGLFDTREYNIKLEPDGRLVITLTHRPGTQEDDDGD